MYSFLLQPTPTSYCNSVSSINITFFNSQTNCGAATAMSTSISISISISVLVFLALTPAATISLSFDMSPITKSDGGRLNLTGDAYITEEGIQVTTNERDQARVKRAGRATYMEALHLWDNATQKIADFSTHFSFVIDSAGNDNFGDGLTFFMAPQGSTIKPWSYGSGLGLRNATSPADPLSMETFVAVEFDTFPNRAIDPPYTGGHVVPHVGIDLNNVSSAKTVMWYNNISAGWENDAWISYSSTTKFLRVNFTGTYAGVTRQYNLSYQVDLTHYLPQFVTVGFSASTGASFQKNNVKSWNFSSTQLNLTLSTVNNTNGGKVNSSPSPSKNNKAVIFGLISTGAAVLLLLLLAFCFLLLKNRNRNKNKNEYEGLEEEQSSDSAMDHEFENGKGPKRFSYKELFVATNDFAEKLGEGGFGSVYKGFLKATNTFIAVKKISEGSKQGRKEYEAEVTIISQLRHINLVELIGWCHRRAELLLVYEFMPNGSLDSHLFKLNSILTWEMRYKIAQGIASALLYLHQGLKQYVVHRDIKASNVMLDDNFNAKLGDFGLARLVDLDKDSYSTLPAGTNGYMAPEYLANWRASKETDIYSFGILLLEIACGRRPIDHKYPGNQIVLVEWVWNLYGAGKLLDAADAKPDSSEYEAACKIERLMVVGLWCVHPDSAQRPSISQVMQVLVSEGCLPHLPPTLPKAIYNVTAPVVVVTTAVSSSDTYSGGNGSGSGSGSGSGGGGAISSSSNLTTSSAGSASDLLPNSSV